MTTSRPAAARESWRTCIYIYIPAGLCIIYRGRGRLPYRFRLPSLPRQNGSVGDGWFGGRGGLINHSPRVKLSPFLSFRSIILYCIILSTVSNGICCRPRDEPTAVCREKVANSYNYNNRRPLVGISIIHIYICIEI